jgi:hypothetical protein
VSEVNSKADTKGEIAAAKILKEWKGSGLAELLDAANRLGILVSGGLLQHRRALKLLDFNMQAHKCDDVHFSVARGAFANAVASVISAEQILAQPANTNTAVTATPFVWIDPAKLPRRECLYGNHYYRKFMTETIGEGGGGKSLHAVVEALAMRSSKCLLGHFTEKPLRVWYVNLEDPIEETQRRFTAAAMHYGTGLVGLEFTVVRHSPSD